jgi:SAM-dependent methyltransferase
MTISGRCNVCCDEGQALLVEGEGGVFAPLPDSQAILEGKTISDYICPNCGSRARLRALKLLLEDNELSPGPAILVSAAAQERAIVARYFPDITHVSMWGDFGDPNCITGIDLRHMPSIETGSFDTVIANGVLDYIPELDQVFSEVRRVLRCGGTFFFFIMPFRLFDSTELTVQVLDRYGLYSDPQVARLADGSTGVPNCRFGIPWLLHTAREAGLDAIPCAMRDPVSDLGPTWYVARPSRIKRKEGH